MDKNDLINAILKEAHTPDDKEGDGLWDDFPVVPYQPMVRLPMPMYMRLHAYPFPYLRSVCTMYVCVHHSCMMVVHHSCMIKNLQFDTACDIGSVCTESYRDMHVKSHELWQGMQQAFEQILVCLTKQRIPS
jgi:hypothetical protein